MYLTTASILVVAGFGIFNVISTIVLEKARDIAIMRSIGMPERHVVAIFMIEGLVVGVVGTIAGWLAGWGLAGLLRLIPAPSSPPRRHGCPVTLSVFLFAVASAIAITPPSGPPGCRRGAPPGPTRWRSSAGRYEHALSRRAR